MRGTGQKDIGSSAALSANAAAPTTPVRGFLGSGFSLALVANLLWGTSFLASKSTLSAWGPFTASTLRFAIGLIAMLIFFPVVGLKIRRPTSKQAWLQIAASGLSGFGLLYPLQLGGLVWIPSSLSAAIMLTSPLFVILFSSKLFGEVLSPIKMTAIFLGMVGGVLLVNPANLATTDWTVDAISQMLKGTLFTFGASIALAVSVLASRSASKHVDSPNLTFWSMLVGTVTLLPFATFEKHPTHGPITFVTPVLALVFLAIACSVIAFLMWNRALKITSPQNIASTMHIKTPVAVILGITVAREPFTFSIIAGTFLVSLAVWLSQQGQVVIPKLSFRTGSER